VRKGWIARPKVGEHSLSKNARLLTATVASLELDPSALPASSEDFDVPNDDHSSDQESVAAAQPSTTPSSSADNSDADDVSESEHAPACDSTTVAQELHMNLGRNNAPVSNDDVALAMTPRSRSLPLTARHSTSSSSAMMPGFALSFATSFLLCWLRKHSTKNKVDITKLPKRLLHKIIQLSSSSVPSKVKKCEGRCNLNSQTRSVQTASGSKLVPGIRIPPQLHFHDQRSGNSALEACKVVKLSFTKKGEGWHRARSRTCLAVGSCN
jgi:hypothetical protein